ncbi:MAG: hypothetical protein KBD01_13925 [Acidobacteria bacterium]|nr:hypothetical protein [Acidobacteriota bacterium]
MSHPEVAEQVSSQAPELSADDVDRVVSRILHDINETGPDALMFVYFRPDEAVPGWKVKKSQTTLQVERLEAEPTI